MIPFQVYKVVHLLGVLSVLVALAALAAHAAQGGRKRDNPLYGALTGLHGLGLLLALVAGFGMAARLGTQGGSFLPGWAWAKLVVWLVFAALAMLPYRRPAFARPVLFLLPVLGAMAAALAVYKPF
jgi:hypothetical protein